MEDQNEVPLNEGAEEIRGFASDVSAENVNFVSGLAFGVSARQDMTMDRSLSFGTAVRRDLDTRDGVTVTAAVGHDLTMNDSAAAFVTVSGSTNIENGAAVFLVGKDVTVRQGGLGVVISRNVHVEEGGSVMMHVSPQQALLFGAAVGIVSALVGRLLRRR